MGTVNRFEDLEIWKLSRELCKDIYEIIESTNLKNNFKLCNQIDSSSGRLWIILQKDLKEMEIKNLFSFCLSPKRLVEKQDHNYIEFLTEISFHRKSLRS